ncbi:PcfJ domain-containing protein [Paenibacillus pasadenensis]|uniref:PcfJ domain-containing protein n=1 Tax=Paenibacillus pasadenensis TaxID=217090 RepID=UPI00041BF830|nr:PcfJ domain-containing protein [Paenibacillus pasadenensis]
MSKQNRFYENEFMRHFPSDISDEIRDYCTDEVLASSRYLFTSREGRQQIAYCTHCKLEHHSDGLRHGKIEECPFCRSACRVKASGRGRKRLIDEAYLIWYEKSTIDPQAIIARGFYMLRDYSGNYRETETVIKPVAMYLFEWGQGGRMLRRDYWSRYINWQATSSVFSEAKRSMDYKPCFHSRANIRRAVEGTPFRYCMWESYEVNDYVKTFDLAARYGDVMEFLTKAGLRSFVVSKLTGGSTYGAINWRGKTPEAVLRLTKAEIKQMRKAGAIGPRALRSYQISKKDGSNYSWEEARTLCDLVDPFNAERLTALSEHAPLPVLKKYIAKQARRDPRRYSAGSPVLIDWRDYLRECRELGRDITRPGVLFPNNLHEAHQLAGRALKLVNDERVNKQIAERLPELLKRYGFERDGLIIRPAVSSVELFDEGKALSHCVGGYADRYAKGETTILLIRRAAALDEPYHTMEVSGTRIVQCRGMKNAPPPPDVAAFVAAFEKAKLTEKKKRSKIKIAQPA